MKKYVCLILTVAMVMILSVSVTAFALPNGTVYRPGDKTIYDGYNGSEPIRYATGEIQSFPGWMWIDGYCYYFTNPNCTEKLTSTTTPDGCQVDDQGRWCVNGAPQYNGYGSYACGTDALYAGKDDAARWATMKDQLEHLYAENIKIADRSPGLALYSGQNWVQATQGAMTISNNANGRYVEARIYSSWCDAPNAYGNMGDELTERTIKLVVGDHVGQELFNDLRAAGEPAIAGGEAYVYNADGTIKSEKKLIYDAEFNTSYYRDVPVTTSSSTTSDGINWGAFPFGKWTNRKTDYEKNFSVYKDPSNDAYFIIDVQ